MDYYRDSRNEGPGKSYAVASMVLGIVAVVFWFFRFTSLLSVILGIIGLSLASSAKKEGYYGGERMAGFILSLLGVIFGGFIFFVLFIVLLIAL